jgi:anti-anti-sigma factor
MFVATVITEWILSDLEPGTYVSVVMRVPVYHDHRPGCRRRSLRRVASCAVADVDGVMPGRGIRMEIREERLEHARVLTLIGRIDTTTAERVDGALASLLDDGASRVVVDFADVIYISSAGLRLFLLAARRLRSVAGTFVLCGLRPSVHQVFDLAGFLPLFTVEPHREAAVARCSAA